ncbi:hypothetical protein MMC20_007455 [Loxospora ochrophaea]|nr:hypothetical protein [Loxospora ochrophaea]
MPTYAITGANRGLGLELARQLGTTPHNTILACTRSLTSDLTALQALVSISLSTIHILECDTSSQPSIAAFASFIASLLGSPTAQLDYLLNNGGINNSVGQSALNTDPESFLAHMATNILGPMKMVEALRPHLQRGSVVMNMSSGLGSCAEVRDLAMTDCAAYGISKAGVNMLSVLQGNELKGDGVVVVAMDPGWVRTRMGGEGARLTPEESVGGMISVLGGLGEGDQGAFLRFSGERKRW